jgi:hypothetical protein
MDLGGKKGKRKGRGNKDGEDDGSGTVLIYF